MIQVILRAHAATLSRYAPQAICIRSVGDTDRCRFTDQVSGRKCGKCGCLRLDHLDENAPSRLQLDVDGKVSTQDFVCEAPYSRTRIVPVLGNATSGLRTCGAPMVVYCRWASSAALDALGPRRTLRSPLLLCPASICLNLPPFAIVGSRWLRWLRWSIGPMLHWLADAYLNLTQTFPQ